MFKPVWGRIGCDQPSFKGGVSDSLGCTKCVRIGVGVVIQLC